VPVSSYRSQGRGGKGSSSVTLRSEDFIEHLFIASTHDYILFITSEGKAYWMKVHEIPEGSKTSRGSHIKTLLAISANEEITSVINLTDFSEDEFIFMATRRGIVKKVKTSDFTNARTRGIIALNLSSNDRLMSSVLTNGKNEVILISRSGNALRFHEEVVRAMGRNSRGIQGLKLSSNDELIGVLRVSDGEQMFLVSENGFGKRVEYNNFNPHGRGTRGQIAYKTDEKTGEVVGTLSVGEEDDIVCITSQGNSIKLHVETIPSQGRLARGVILVNIEKPDQLVGVARVVNEKDEEE
jgi:DNA gyrase subunit A